MSATDGTVVVTVEQEEVAFEIELPAAPMLAAGDAILVQNHTHGFLVRGPTGERVAFLGRGTARFYSSDVAVEAVGPVALDLGGVAAEVVASCTAPASHRSEYCQPEGIGVVLFDLRIGDTTMPPDTTAAIVREGTTPLTVENRAIWTRDDRFARSSCEFHCADPLPTVLDVRIVYQ